MLQSIQFVGSGPPTYIYTQKAAGSSMEFYQVFAAETREHDGKKEKRSLSSRLKKKNLEENLPEAVETREIEPRKQENLQEVYAKEYGRRESFLWKQR